MGKLILEKGATFLQHQMELLKISKKDVSVGIDIGSSSIKLVRLVRRESGLTLNKAELRELAHSEDTAVAENEKLKALKEILDGINIKKSHFFVSINCPKTGVRVITAPHMPKTELKEGILLEAKNFFPSLIEEAYLDFQILGETVEKGVQRYRVAIAASPQKTIDGALALLKKVGIRPDALVPIPLALSRLGNLSHKDEEKIRCFVDIGEHQSDLVILKGKNLIFSRQVPIGGNDFTTAMTGVLVSDRGRMALSLEEAEKIKREVGIPPASEPRMVDEKVSSVQLASLLRSPLEQLANEIDRCLDYYQEETGGERVDSLTLFGRGSSLKGLSEALSDELGVEVRTGSPLEGIKIEAQIVTPVEGMASFAGAAGAALAGNQGINLLPPRLKEEMERALRRASIQSLASFVILLLAFLYIGMKIQLSNFHKRIEVAQLELSTLQSEFQRVKTQIAIHNVLADEPYWEDVLREISGLIPPSAHLTELSLSERKITLKGVIVSKDKETALSGFILDLEKGILKNVKLVTSREGSDKLTAEFEIDGGMD